MTKKVVTDLDAMTDSRYWFEAEAEERGREEGRLEGRLEGGQQMLYGLVRDGDLSAAKAAERLGITEEQLRKDMEAASSVVV